jgi:atypical dual specificity phosphatase
MMNPPYGFSWVRKPYLAASSLPGSPEELTWLRQQGIDIVLTLTEYPMPRKWIDDSGLMNVHIPIPDMGIPTNQETEKALSTIEKAKHGQMGVLVHCMAGKGRTGTILACQLVREGLSAEEAINVIRMTRPGSIETDHQARYVRDFAKAFGKAVGGS